MLSEVYILSCKKFIEWKWKKKKNSYFNFGLNFFSMFVRIWDVGGNGGGGHSVVAKSPVPHLRQEFFFFFFAVPRSVKLILLILQWFRDVFVWHFNSSEGKIQIHKFFWTVLLWWQFACFVLLIFAFFFFLSFFFQNVI